MKFSNLWYDRLKWLCLIAMPAIITFINVVLPVCGAPLDVTKAVCTVLGAISTLIGSLIGISCVNYHADKENEP